MSLIGTTVHVVHTASCPDLGPSCAVREEEPHLHDQRLNILELRAIGELALSDHWSVDVQIPIKLTNVSIDYHTLDGAPYTPALPDIHHRNETLTGLGDPWLGLRFGTSLGPWAVSARGGVSIPLGRTEPDPFELGERGIAHQHVQFGTGTLDPWFALDVSRRFGIVEARAFAQALLVLYRNEHGYQAGNRTGAGLIGAVDVFETLRLSTGLELYDEAPERWGGLVQQDGNLGRTELFLGLSATMQLAGLEWTLGARLPIARHVVTDPNEPGTLTSPGILDLTVAKTFEL